MQACIWRKVLSKNCLRRNSASAVMHGRGRSAAILGWVTELSKSEYALIAGLWNTCIVKMFRDPRGVFGGKVRSFAAVEISPPVALQSPAYRSSETQTMLPQEHQLFFSRVRTNSNRWLARWNALPVIA